MPTTIRAAALIVALTVVVSYSSLYGHDRSMNRQRSADHQLAILEGRLFESADGAFDVPEFRNRILVPALMRPLTAAGVAPFPAFLAVRLMTAIAMFTLIWWTVHVAWGRGEQLAAAATALVSGLLVLSFSGPTENPTDFPDVFAITAFCALAVAGRFRAAVAVAAVMALNRESAIFGGVIWMFAADRSMRRRIVEGAAIGGMAVLVSLSARSLFALPGAEIVNAVTLLDMPAFVWASVTNAPGPGEWYVRLAAMAALIWLWTQWTEHRPHHGLLRAGAAVAGVTLVFGLWAEIRIFLPAAVCLVLASVAPARDDAAVMRR